MSPNNILSSDQDDLRRALSSPAGLRQPKGPNGPIQQPNLAQQPFVNPNNRPPTRPRREDDVLSDEGTDGTTETITVTRDRAMSPDQTYVRAKSPQGHVVSRAVSPAPDISVQPVNLAGVVMGINGVGSRSASPVFVDRSKPPQDAFYSSTGSGSPTGNDFRNVAGSTGNLTADLIRDLKNKEAEVDAMKKKDIWMKMALAQAYRSGFVYSNMESGEDEDMAQNIDMDSDDPGEQRIMEMSLKFKQLKTHMHVRLLHILNGFVLMECQSAMVDQARQASERLADAERLRTNATQEAAYYRAKLTALEASNISEATRLDQERISDLERHISALMAERWSQDRKIGELSDSLALQTTLTNHAEARATEANKRAEKLEESHTRTLQQNVGLQERHDTSEATVRDHADKLLTKTSALEQKEAEGMNIRAQLEELTRSRDQHVRAIEQARTALQAASTRADEVDVQYKRAREQIGQLEGDLAELRGELEARTHEAESARARLTDVENSWANSRQEADAFRALTTGSLGELLDSHRELKSDEDRLTLGHTEKIQAIEAETASLRKLLKESTQQAEANKKALVQERLRARDHEAEESFLRSQTDSLRAQLSNAVAENGRLRKEWTEMEHNLQERTKDHTDLNLRLGTLKAYLAENGLNIDENTHPQSSGGAVPTARVNELEEMLADRTRQHETLERELAQMLRRHQDAEAQANILSTQLDRLRSTQSPASTDSEARALDAERKLEETERGYKARMQQMEEDYQLAVHYVK
jgi:hypothetical protein